MPQRNAVSVLPDPVGARISVCSPEAMAGQPCSWAAVGARNDDENQARTGSENRSSEPIRPAYGGVPTAGPPLVQRPGGRPLEVGCPDPDQLPAGTSVEDDATGGAGASPAGAGCGLVRGAGFALRKKYTSTGTR